MVKRLITAISAIIQLDLIRNRFVQVDTKLKPIRSDNGEIQVNADFEVEDRFPVSPYIRVSNDGSRQTSGWRATLGAEFWESQ